MTYGYAKGLQRLVVTCDSMSYDLQNMDTTPEERTIIQDTRKLFLDKLNAAGYKLSKTNKLMRIGAPADKEQRFGECL